MDVSYDALGERNEHLNPCEGASAHEPEEWIMGAYRTKKELLEILNKNSRVTFTEEDHDDDALYIRVRFEQGEQ